MPENELLVPAENMLTYQFLADTRTHYLGSCVERMPKSASSAFKHFHGSRVEPCEGDDGWHARTEDNDREWAFEGHSN